MPMMSAEASVDISRRRPTLRQLMSAGVKGDHQAVHLT